MKKLVKLLCVLILGLIAQDVQAQTNPAAGDNQAQVAPGVFAIYSGDANQDGTIDGSDFLIIDAAIQNFDGGYVVSDLNGDGGVDGTDFLIVDANIQNFIGVVTP
jgi:hypothetical protein